MWTHVEVIVHRAVGLPPKGKDGKNDIFAIIELGKDKFQTSVKEKATALDPVFWNEDCELRIPDKGNQAVIVITFLHRHFLNDKVLGLVSIPLSGIDPSAPRSRSGTQYTLQNKKGDVRGQVYVSLQFYAKGVGNISSDDDAAKKRSSIGQLASSLRGSFSKLNKKDQKESSAINVGGNSDPHDNFFVMDDIPVENSFELMSTSPLENPVSARRKSSFDSNQMGQELETISSTRKKSSASLNKNLLSIKITEAQSFGDVETTEEPVPKPRRLSSFATKSDHEGPPDKAEAEANNASTPDTLIVPLSPLPLPKSDKSAKESKSNKTEKPPSSPKIKRSIKDAFLHPRRSFLNPSEDYENKQENIDEKTIAKSSPPVGITIPIPIPKSDNLKKSKGKSKDGEFHGKSKEELIQTITNLQDTVQQQQRKIDDMEDYLLSLLVNVMEADPSILQMDKKNVK